MIKKEESKYSPGEISLRVIDNICEKLNQSLGAKKKVVVFNCGSTIYKEIDKIFQEAELRNIASEWKSLHSIELDPDFEYYTYGPLCTYYYNSLFIVLINSNHRNIVLENGVLQLIYMDGKQKNISSEPKVKIEKGSSNIGFYGVNISKYPIRDADFIDINNFLDKRGAGDLVVLSCGDFVHNQIYRYASKSCGFFDKGKFSMEQLDILKHRDIHPLKDYIPKEQVLLKKGKRVFVLKRDDDNSSEHTTNVITVIYEVKQKNISPEPEASNQKRKNFYIAIPVFEPFSMSNQNDICWNLDKQNAGRFVVLKGNKTSVKEIMDVMEQGVTNYAAEKLQLFLMNLDSDHPLYNDIHYNPRAFIKNERIFMVFEDEYRSNTLEIVYYEKEKISGQAIEKVYPTPFIKWDGFVHSSLTSQICDLYGFKTFINTDKDTLRIESPIVGKSNILQNKVPLNHYLVKQNDEVVVMSEDEFKEKYTITK